MRLAVLLLLAGCASAGYRSPLQREVDARCGQFKARLALGAPFADVERDARAQGFWLTKSSDSLTCTTNRWGW